MTETITRIGQEWVHPYGYRESGGERIVPFSGEVVIHTGRVFLLLAWVDILTGEDGSQRRFYTPVKTSELNSETPWVERNAATTTAPTPLPASEPR